MPTFDFGKALGFHRMYGHYWFIREMARQNKSKKFAKTICGNLSCKEK